MIHARKAKILERKMPEFLNGIVHAYLMVLDLLQ